MNDPQILQAVPARDGAGVNIHRIAGAQVHALLDPFLMLDEIRSDDGDDYMAGFPSHPHRGFETITYLLDGRMRHRDHMGHDSVMEPGGVQWMTAGRGVVHSEMPELSEGRFHGFQVWLNLAADRKMSEPAYFDIASDQIPEEHLADVSARLISGSMSLDDRVVGARADLREARPLIADIRLRPGAATTLSLPDGQKLLVYIYEGGAAGVQRGQMAVAAGGQMRLVAEPSGLAALVLGGTPLKEPVVQYGPFVMNTREQIEQALEDFSSGQLAAEGESHG